MPRILTAETTKEVVIGLKRTAKRNKRPAGQEALVAIESHILAESLKHPTRKPRKP